MPEPAKIRDLLLEALPKRFPNQSFRKVDDEYPEIHVQTRFPEFGDFLVGDDEDEAIVQTSRFSHSHFGCYEETLTLAQKQERVVDDILHFLEKVFADQVVFWGNHGRGGWYLRGHKPSTPISSGDRGPEYVWSGPLKK